MFDDDYLRKRAEQLRVSAGDSYRKAAKYDELREGAVSGVVDEVRRMEERGVEVNIAAVARMTGISRQTLHARLSAARPSL